MNNNLKNIQKKLSYFFVILGFILVIINAFDYLSSCCSMNIPLAMLIGLIFVATGYILSEK